MRDISKTTAHTGEITEVPMKMTSRSHNGVQKKWPGFNELKNLRK